MVQKDSPPLPQTSMGSVYNGPSKTLAMSSSPGPGAYCLPGTTGLYAHDPSRKKSPGYTFGTRTRQFCKMNIHVDTPGPIYYISPCLTRNGRDGIPSSSLHRRVKKVNISCGPGPAAYHTGIHNNPHLMNAPIYSFGLKTAATGAVTRESRTPAPNSYILPTLLGDKIVGKKTNPCHTMAGRTNVGSFHEDLSNTPGPGAYTPVSPDVYTNKSPVYTLHHRAGVPEEKTRVPGPGTHNPEQAMASRHKQAPKYTFGIKHSIFSSAYMDRVF